PACQDVVAAASGKRIVASAAIERVGDDVAGQAVVTGAADGVFDIGPRIVVEQIGVEDVALRVMPVSEIGELRGRSYRRRAGIEVDGDVGGVVRQVVGIGAVTVPDRLEDAVGGAAGPVAGRRLRHAVDELLPGGRALGVHR